MLAREELTSNIYDDIRFQRVIVEEMGELLPAKLLAECDLSRARSVLEIGCGTGEWLRAVARQYPDLQCIGIDQDELQVKAANALAYRDGLAQVAFLAHEINDLPPTLFPEASFDLVHLSFLSRYILTADYPALARMCAVLKSNNSSQKQHGSEVHDPKSQHTGHGPHTHIPGSKPEQSKRPGRLDGAEIARRQWYNGRHHHGSDHQRPHGQEGRHCDPHSLRHETHRPGLKSKCKPRASSNE